MIIVGYIYDKSPAAAGLFICGAILYDADVGECYRL